MILPSTKNKNCQHDSINSGLTQAFWSDLREDGKMRKNKGENVFLYCLVRERTQEGFWWASIIFSPTYKK